MLSPSIFIGESKIILTRHFQGFPKLILKRRNICIRTKIHAYIFIFDSYSNAGGSHE